MLHGKMRRNTISGLAFLLLAASCIAAPSSSPPSSNSDALTKSFNSFSLDLFSQMAKSAGQQNLLLLPYCVTSVLSMMIHGAKGSTAEHLIKSLQLDIDADGKDKGLQLISDDLSRKSNGSVSSLDNSLLMQEEAQTSNKTVFGVFENAIAWNVLWDQRFNPRLTSKRTFYKQGLHGVARDFMQQTWLLSLQTAKNVSGSVVTVVELPYANNSYSMVIVLPDKIDGLTQLLSAPDFKDQILLMLTADTGDKAAVNVKLPKFRLETEYDLVPALKDLGLSGIFERGSLSGTGGTNNLTISSIKHKASVQVDEEGADAAPVNWGVASGDSFVVQPAHDFEVHHPFLFFIKEKESGMILFAGKVEDL